MHDIIFRKNCNEENHIYDRIICNYYLTDITSLIISHTKYIFF